MRKSDALRPVCPAALTLAGPPGSGPSVLCGVQYLDKQLADEVAEGRAQPGLMTQRTMPTVIAGFCCGTGIPVDDEPPLGRNHYTFCPTWRARKEADWANRERAVPVPEHGPGRTMRGEHSAGSVVEELLG